MEKEQERDITSKIHLPMAASLVSFECHSAARRILSAISSTPARCDFWKASAHATVALDAGLIVSVRPCLKAAVLQDS